MKKLALLFGAALLSLGAGAQSLPIAASGGPDAFGYEWKTSAAAGGPTYRWIDITTRGTLVNGLSDDNLAPGVIAMPFGFPFYLETAQQFRIGSNGYITFSNRTSLSQPFPTIPTVDRAGSANSSFVAGYLSDLKFDADPNFPNLPNAGRCYYYLNADSVVVSYIDAPFWQVGDSTRADFRGANTFQIILSRLDTSITVQYKDMDPQLTVVGPNAPNQAVIGLEDYTQNIGIQAGLNQVPANGTALRFTRSQALVAQFRYTDVGVAWAGNPAGAAFFGMVNEPIPVEASLRNFGNQDVGAFQANYKVQRYNGIPALAADTLLLPRLLTGTDTLVAFAPVVLADTGRYRLTVTTAVTSDLFFLNNFRRVLFSVIDTAARPRISLSYDRAVPDQVVPTGAGVYFRPPYYPAELAATDAFVMTTGAPGTPAATAMRVRVYADNGPQGRPGTLLYDGVVPQSTLQTGSWNRLALPAGVRINSGGFYVAWEPQQLSTTFIGAHRGPEDQLLGRSFEITANGVWMPYRFANDNIAIGATLNTRPSNVTGTSHDRTNTLAFRSVFPNPSAERATISYSVKQSAPVTLTVTDLLGRPVRTLALGQPAAGEHQYELNVQDLPAGLYLCSLRAGNATLTQKMVVQH